MNSCKFLIFIILILAATAFSQGADQCLAQSQEAVVKEPLSDILAVAKGKVKPSDIKAVAARMAAAKAAAKARAATEESMQNQPSSPAPVASDNTGGGQ